ncbi:MAG TPA: CDP-diacylglycerol--glycerol-3-phosphate 3-phosphatidyltransferase [Planctomycetota bacterium]|nr:CDP-diacylglycerol--glycerol-3-phosphate 3-phosphatidyltransferase [Planctomycetota bacterium]HUW35639.1 CDP-diacylglycerol--glycerol-3-phosphate 3-phosphatidyltransferase [Planctomycetota bacterium]
MNLPNKFTLARLVLTAIFFVLIAVARAGDIALLIASLLLFIAAALTDLIDGWLARKYQMVTDFGRVADPFADKILICGALIFLLAKGHEISRVRDWMVVIILAREFLVSGMRSMAESRGIPFGATYWGKLKMLSQNFAVSFSIIYMMFSIFPSWAVTYLRVVTDVVLYLTTALTAMSGIVYVARAKKVLDLDA